MKLILKSIDNYFKKMFQSLGDNKLMTPNAKGVQNLILMSKANDDGWSEWHPLKKNIITSFDELEKKFGIIFHNDIIDYYNTYWFYEIYGYMYIDDHMDIDVVELQGIIPGEELEDFVSNIENYYHDLNSNQIRMIPIGMVQNLFVVIDNFTGEVFIDDQVEFGVFRKIANSLSELIDNLSMDPPLSSHMTQ